MTSTDQPRAALIVACRQLASAGLSPGSSGNLSVRVGESILITPTGSALSRVDAAELAMVDPGGGAATPAPSKELPLHRAVYAARPDAHAVIHLHSPHATALSCLQPDANGDALLPNLTPYRVMRLGTVPLVPYAPPGSSALSAGVARVAADNAVILLANHGCLVAGTSLEMALDRAEELETAAQVTLLLGAHLSERARALELEPDAVTHLQHSNPRSSR